MSIDKIRQAAKTLVEASYEYNSLLSKKASKAKLDSLKMYMLQISRDIDRWVEAELRNVRR
ncbi:MAG: hypothetical protein QW404_03430 [Candidatus Nanoarchaeia archaeon]